MSLTVVMAICNAAMRQNQRSVKEILESVAVMGKNNEAINSSLAVNLAFFSRILCLNGDFFPHFTLFRSRKARQRWQDNLCCLWSAITMGNGLDEPTLPLGILR